MKKSKDRGPYNGYGYPQSGYGFPPNNGYQQNGYGGYPQNNGYQQNGGYGGYPGYGYPGYPGYGYPGYPGYGYPGFPGYGGYGNYPQMNYIADNYPKEDYGNPNDPTDQSVRHDSEHGARESEAPEEAKESAPEQEAVAAPEAEPVPEPEEETQAPPPPAEEPEHQTYAPPAEEEQRPFAGDYDDIPANYSTTYASDSNDVESLKAEAADLKRKWYSVTAEYDNYRKRTQNVKLEAYQEGRADVVKQLFPIGDNLDRAVKSCQDETTRKGINMVLTAFEKLLDSENITVINPVGQPFDPNECEAIMAVDAAEGQESGIVTDVYVKGYAQGDKVLRYAQVIVTK